MTDYSKLTNKERADQLSISAEEYDKLNGTEASKLGPMKYKYLSTEQRQVVEYLYQGLPISQIADKMAVSARTVDRLKTEAKQLIIEYMQKYA